MARRIIHDPKEITRNPAGLEKCRGLTATRNRFPLGPANVMHARVRRRAFRIRAAEPEPAANMAAVTSYQGGSPREEVPDSPVIDQPQLVVRPQEIRILDGTIWVLNQAVEPHNGRRDFVIHPLLVTRTEALSVRQQLNPRFRLMLDQRSCPSSWCGSSIGVPGGMSALDRRHEASYRRFRRRFRPSPATNCHCGRREPHGVLDTSPSEYRNFRLVNGKG